MSVDHGDFFGGAELCSCPSCVPGYHAAEAACVICLTKSVSSDFIVCSRRCQWVSQDLCPQCSRPALGYHAETGMTIVYCGSQCAVEARQANWCVCCGVRQVEHGHNSCGFDQCAFAAGFLSSLLFGTRPARTRATALPQRRQHQPYAAATATVEPPHVVEAVEAASHPHYGPAAFAGTTAGRLTDFQPARRNHERGFVPHEPLLVGDKLRSSFDRQLTPYGVSMVGAVKLGGPHAPRKRFLAYRARTEEELVAHVGRGTPKWGHGGEGNEQRRYIPLRVTCYGAVDGQSTCHDAQCDACRLMSTGLKLQKSGCDFFVTTGHISKAVDACLASTRCASTGESDGDTRSSSVSSANTTCMAFAVCRVVVGNPLHLESREAVVVPSSPFHSVVVDGAAPDASVGRMAPTRGGGYHNVAQEAPCFIFRDEAIDAQHIVFFRTA